MGRVVDEERALDPVGEGDRAVGDVGFCSGGRGKKKLRGFQANWDRSGGFRTFNTILNDLSARLAWGTYLVPVSGLVLIKAAARTYLFAYATFSEYMPLAKNSRRVVTLTNSSPVETYGWT
jgi:hypothetical protein